MDKPKTSQEALTHLRQHYFDSYNGSQQLDLIEHYVNLRIEEALREFVTAKFPDDGKWHQVVATYGPNGLSLTVDPKPKEPSP